MPDANQETVRLASKGPEGSRAGRWRVVVHDPEGAILYDARMDIR